MWQLRAIRRALHPIRESVFQVLVFAVNPEGAFLNISLQMLFAHLMVSTAITALEQAPKRINAVRLAIPINVMFIAVVDNGESVLEQPATGAPLIGVKHGSVSHVFVPTLNLGRHQKKSAYIWP